MSTILIVEDQLIIAADLRQIVEEWPGCQAMIARSADAALRIARERRLDLAVIDIDLGRSTVGIDVAIQLRDAFLVKSIFISAFLDETTRKLAQRADPIAYVQKPFAITDVRDAVQAALGDPLPIEVSRGR